MQRHVPRAPRVADLPHIDAQLERHDFESTTKIGKRAGSVNAALLPIGAYEPAGL